MPEANSSTYEELSISQEVNVYERRHWAQRKFIIGCLLVIITLCFLLSFVLWPEIFNKAENTFPVARQHLLIVVFGSILGSTISALNNFVANLSRQAYQKGWLSAYITRVLLGVPLGLFSYFMIRGVILSPDANPQSLNRFGLAFISVLIGLFEAILIDRLSEIFQAAYGKETALEKRIDQIGNLLGVQLLTNYNGFLSFLITENSEERKLVYEGNRLNVLANRTYQLRLRFRPTRSDASRQEQIIISGGSDDPIIEFKITLNSRFLRVAPKQSTVSFNVFEESPEMKFNFDVLDQSEESEFWVEVSQKNRLIIVIPTKIIAENNIALFS